MNAEFPVGRRIDSRVALLAGLLGALGLSLLFCLPTHAQTLPALHLQRMHVLRAGELNSASGYLPVARNTAARGRDPVVTPPASSPAFEPEPGSRRVISVHLEGVTVEEALKHIAAKAGLRLSYGSRAVAVGQKVTLDLIRVPALKATQQVIEGTDLTATISSGYLIVARRPEAKLRSAGPELIELPVRIQVPAKLETFAHPLQTGMIAGTVTDSATGSPLPGVNVVIAGTQQGAATDAQGHYTIAGIEPGTYTLHATFIGYTDAVKEGVVVEEGQTTTVNFTLQPAALGLDEVVVVGYGTQEKSSLSSAVTEISAAEIAKKEVTDPRRALQGIAAGISVIDRGGAPGKADLGIKIRGNTTLGSDYPLILVNGIQQDFSSINPNNIASITVLKDAAATAIYGSRAANGVILVTTKEPQAGELSVSYDAYVGVEELSNEPEHMGLETYMRMQNAAYANQPGGEPIYSEEYIQEYVNAENRLKYPLPNVMWDAVFSPGLVQSHSLAFSGGTEQLSARLSLRYFNQTGIAPNFGATKKSARLDTDYDVSDRINVTARLMYRRTDNLRPTDLHNVYWRLWHSTQWVVPQYPDGTYGVSGQGWNPLMTAEMSGDHHQSIDYFIANFKGEVELLDNLTFTSQFGGHISLLTETQFSNQFTIHDYFTGEVVKQTGFNSLSEERERDQRWTWKNLLNYDLRLQQHRFELLAGFEQAWGQNEWLDTYRNQFYNNSLRAISAGSEENWSNDGGINEVRLRSVFGRVRYLYADKYIFTASARYDGSSKFYGADNQYSFFPAFSAAWRLSEESFWEPIRPVVNNLKLRASWGKAGNNTVDLYTFFRGINVGTNYTFNGQLVRTAAVAGLVNRNLTWETTTQWDIGLDAEFLNGLFGLTFDYWHKRTEGILLTLPIPDIVGLGAPPQNAGIVDNRGWGLSVTHQNTIGADFSYSVEANLSDFRNEVVDLAGTGPYTGYTVTKVGAPLNALWGFKALGLFQSREEIANYPTWAPKENTFPGDIKYADLNGDGKISPADRTVIGYQDPHYSFGITTNMNYKNFNLSFLIQGVGQQDRVPKGGAIECGNWAGYTLELCSDYWTPENRDARIPRPQKFSLKNQAGNQAAMSSWWLIDASYVKLKNVQLGYTLPFDLTDGLGVNRLRIYVSGTDLFTLSEATKWGLDPEFPSGRLDYYPQTSQYTVGIDLNF